MKKSLKSFSFSLILLFFIDFAQIGLRQAPPPTPAENGSNDNKGPGGGAAIDGGVFVLMTLVTGFGTWKLIKAAQKKNHPIEL